jgi:hypothetical protein
VTTPYAPQIEDLPETSEVALLVEAEAIAQDEILDNLVEEILLLWSTFSAFYAGDLVQQFATDVAQLVLAAQRAAGQITEAHLREQVTEMGFDLPSTTLVDLPDALRLGAYPDEVYQRPVRQLRYLHSVEDVPLEEAAQTARERLEKQAATDLQLARTLSAQQVLYRFPEASGWRRIIHPELGNVCGLCIAAADRVYQRIQRMDLHPGCKCTILPIVGEQDPGLVLNTEDLTRIYAQAGGTTESRALSKTRFEVKMNGELGAILIPQGESLKGPRQVAKQLSPEAKSRRREQLERQTAQMRAKGRLSQWDQDRLGQLEELLAAA